MQKSQEDEGQKYDNFLRWFLREGGYMGDLKFARFPPSNYLGIAATSNIKKNTIVLGIPKKLIIGIDRVRQSQLSEIIQNQVIFSGEASDDKDFNILAIFIILQKMKENESFYAPYLNTIQLAQTLISWSNEQIEQIGDPFLNTNYVQDVRKDFEPIFSIFKNIVNNNRHLFRKQLTRELFDFCYGIVMTRCFGWGLPQTMIVPFADFLNHYSNGVHHYVFSFTMENEMNQQYIKKSNCLDLRIFGKDNTASLPIAYQKDSREKFIEKNVQILQKKGIVLTQDIRTISHKDSRQLLQLVQNEKIQQNFGEQLNLSSDSQDNDSIDEEQFYKNDPSMLDKVKQVPYLRRFYEIRDFFKKIDHLVDAYKDQRFNEPSPDINREFQDDVGFSWWYKTQDAQFIVATSRNTAKGEQIFNSYGRRNNRFLLLWYGFTFDGNKYDSVPFRIWSPTVEMKTGRLIYAKYLTQKEWKERIPIGNSRYAFSQLSHEIRLKLTSINYHLLAFLRFRNLSSNKQRRHLLSQNKNLISITDLSLELQILQDYMKILTQLEGQYNLSRNKLDIKAQHRRCFAQILVQSNRAIIHSHTKGVAYLLRLLNKFIGMDKKQISLIEIYKQPWSEEQSQQERVKNRFFVNHYFKMLHDFQNI